MSLAKKQVLVFQGPSDRYGCPRPTKTCDKAIPLNDVAYTVIGQHGRYFALAEGRLDPPYKVSQVELWVPKDRVLSSQEHGRRESGRASAAKGRRQAQDREDARARREEARLQRQRARAERRQKRRDAKLARRLRSTAAVVVYRAGFSATRARAVALGLSSYARRVSRRGVSRPIDVILARSTGYSRGDGREAYARMLNGLAGGMSPALVRKFLSNIATGARAGQRGEQMQIMLVRRSLARAGVIVTPKEAGKLLAHF